jgi:hypothetical protein
MQARLHHHLVVKPDAIVRILLLRLQGWSKYALAKEYEADKTSIEYWCDKFEIQPILGGHGPVRQVTVVDFTVKVGKPHKYQYLFDEEDNINEGRDYIQYRVESRRRELIKLGALA